VEHVEGVPWRGYGNAEAYVEWNGMDMDPHYGSICGFRGMDLNPDPNPKDIEVYLEEDFRGILTILVDALSI
jgi:hypothetical protein